MADAQQQHLMTLTLTTWTASLMILQHAHLLHPIVHVDIPLVSIHPHHPNSSGVPRPHHLMSSNSRYHRNAHPKAHIMLMRTMTTG
jgi:capsular polysaccharide biosynthesis protein